MDSAIFILSRDKNFYKNAKKGFYKTIQNVFYKTIQKVFLFLFFKYINE